MSLRSLSPAPPEVWTPIGLRRSWFRAMGTEVVVLLPVVHAERAAAVRDLFARWEAAEDRFVRRDVHRLEVWAADAGTARRLAQQEIQRVPGYKPSWRIRQVARVKGAPARRQSAPGR